MICMESNWTVRVHLLAHLVPQVLCIFCPWGSDKKLLEQNGSQHLFRFEKSEELSIFFMYAKVIIWNTCNEFLLEQKAATVPTRMNKPLHSCMRNHLHIPFLKMGQNIFQKKLHFFINILECSNLYVFSLLLESHQTYLTTVYWEKFCKFLEEPFLLSFC